MNNSRNGNGFIVRVIEKITEEGTFLKEKKVLSNEEEALRVYDVFNDKYPELKIECYNYKTDVMVDKNY